MEQLSYIDSWREAAACFDRTDVDFFADNRAATSAALKTCARCPVTDECLSWALETNQRDGVWGGHTPSQRKSLRREWLRVMKQAS